jgi:hypothetical protein
MQFQASLAHAMNPNTDHAQADKEFTTLAGQVDAFEAWDKRRDVVTKTKSSLNVKNALLDNSNKILAATSSKIDFTDIPVVNFNALKAEPFSFNRDAAIVDNPKPEGVLDLYGMHRAFIPPETAQLVNELNQHYRVLSNYMSRPEAQKWAATTLDDLRLSKTDPAKLLEQGKVTEPDVLPDEAIATGMLPMAGKAPGMLLNGNIDLEDRIVVDNADGTQSTLQSITIEEDGKYILIPTLNPKGEKLSDEDAVTLYHYLGEHLGIFSNQKDADDFAKNLSMYMERAK